jgi:hypothetical protein
MKFKNAPKKESTRTNEAWNLRRVRFIENLVMAANKPEYKIKEYRVQIINMSFKDRINSAISPIGMPQGHDGQQIRFWQ